MNNRLGFHVRAGLGLGITLFATSACDDPLSQVEAIDKTRVVGAKIEVAGDPTRAAPLPGEDVVVRFLVLAPDPEPSFAYALTACAAADSASDLATCAGEPLATAASLSPVPQAPSIAFVAPAEATAEQRLAVLGNICSSGVGLPAEAASTCDDGSPVRATTLDFYMDDGNHPNTNPALTSVSVDGTELAPETALTTDCAELPQVPAGAVKHGLNVKVDDASRDPIVRETGADPTRESLLFSYFVSRGGVDHAFSGLESGDGSNSTGALWTAPASVSGPSLARFVIVVRDGRGGSDFAERRICLVPR
jgi:hypothetical protein